MSIINSQVSEGIKVYVNVMMDDNFKQERLLCTVSYYN